MYILITEEMHQVNLNYLNSKQILMLVHDLNFNPTHTPNLSVRARFSRTSSQERRHPRQDTFVVIFFNNKNILLADICKISCPASAAQGCGTHFALFVVFFYSPAQRHLPSASWVLHCLYHMCTTIQVAMRTRRRC
jgi:hypothetical protein